MKNMKQKIKFTDIAGMLERDEMREIVGGCGCTNASGEYIGWSTGMGGGGGGVAGFGGGAAIGSSFGGAAYSGYSNAMINSFNAPSTNAAGTANSSTTSNPTTIKRFMSYLDWENVILNNNPTSSQMISFLNEDRLTSGRGTLTDGTTLANEATMYMLGNTLQWTNNPYEQFIKPENLAHIMQNMGDAITAGGLAFSATGVGSVVGVPMSSFGTAMNSVGTAWEVGLQAYDAYNGVNTNQNLVNISETIAFYTLQNLIEKKLLNGLDVTPKQMAYIKQTLGLELNYIQGDR